MSTADVSWSQPFGNSLAGQGYDQLENNIDSAFPGLMTKPAKRDNPNDPKNTLPQPPPPATPAPPVNAQSGAPLSQLAPSNNSQQEDSLRAAYMNALNPNYGFSFNNNAPTNKFSANANIQKGK